MEKAGDFRWKPLVVKVLAMLIAGGAAWPTAGQVIDIIKGAGYQLSSEDIQIVTWLVTAGLPTLYVGIKNAVKHSKWWRNRRERKAAKSLSKFAAGVLVLMVLAGCVTTTAPDGTTTQQIDPVALQLAISEAHYMIDIWQQREEAAAARDDAKAEQEAAKWAAIWEAILAKREAKAVSTSP